MADNTVTSPSTVFFDVCNNDQEVADIMGFRVKQGCTLLGTYRQPKALFDEIQDVTGDVLQSDTFKIYRDVTVVITAAAS